jgi:hypothetical protein
MVYQAYDTIDKKKDILIDGEPIKNKEDGKNEN